MAQNEWGRRREQGEGAVPGPRSFFRALGSGDRSRADVGEKLDFPRLSTAACFCILGENRVAETLLEWTPKGLVGEYNVTATLTDGPRAPLCENRVGLGLMSDHL